VNVEPVWVGKEMLICKKVSEREFVYAGNYEIPSAPPSR